jgi:SAM-dependent methyltransferase
MGSSRPVQSVTNTELYNRWAKVTSLPFLPHPSSFSPSTPIAALRLTYNQVYDTDGNILQSIDDLMLPDLLNQVFTFLPSSNLVTITELGCGTGRNTVKLLTPSPAFPQITSIAALDLSPGMLTIAKQRCEDHLKSNASDTTQAPPLIEFHEFDALNPDLSPEINALERKADLVLSTLVLEHLPLDVFFRTVKYFLRSGGYVLLTNMHAGMGRISQAGFVDEVTGEKIRGHSYAHETSQVVEEGEKWGFEVVGEVGERAVGSADLGTVVGERGKKWIGVNVWFGFVMRLSQMETQP